MTDTEYGSITMEGAKKLTNIFIAQGPVKVSNWKQTCETCETINDGQDYDLIDVSQRNHLRLWWGTKICWKCNVCGHVSWRDSQAIYLQGSFNP